MMLGLGQVAQGNPNAGTYSDINCPNACFVLGNLLDTSILGAECWPCHNVCPAGTVWDTTTLACSSTPTTTNPVVPVNQQVTPNPDPCTQALGIPCSTLALYALGAIALIAVISVVHKV